MVSEGWAVELRGEQFDLDDLRHALKPPFDPWVEDYQHDGRSVLLLRSHGWMKLQSGAEVVEDARRLIDQINGAHIVVQSDARPVSFGITFRFDSEGNSLPVVIAAVGHIRMSGGRAHGRLMNTPAGPPCPPAPSPMQEMLARAIVEDTVADLLIFITRADNWFDIFKGMELIEEMLGGEGQVKKQEISWKSLKQTANWHRHAPGWKHQLPKNPPDISDAKDTLLRMANHVLVAMNH